MGALKAFAVPRGVSRDRVLQVEQWSVRQSQRTAATMRNLGTCEEKQKCTHAGKLVCHALTCLGPYLTAKRCAICDGQNQSDEASLALYGTNKETPVSALYHVFGVSKRDHQVMRELHICGQVLSESN